MCTQVQWEEQVLAGGIFGLQTNFQSSISARFLSLLKKDGGPTFLGSGKFLSLSASLPLTPFSFTKGSVSEYAITRKLLFLTFSHCIWEGG